MFQFSGFATISCSLQLHRFPHSDIGGSRVVCTSPPLFAAYHVLRRLREPRHPPCALRSLPSFRQKLRIRYFYFAVSSFALTQTRSLTSQVRSRAFSSALIFCFSSFPFHYDFLPVLSMNFLQPSSCNTSSSLAQAWAYPKNIYRS